MDNHDTVFNSLFGSDLSFDNFFSNFDPTLSQGPVHPVQVPVPPSSLPSETVCHPHNGHVNYSSTINPKTPKNRETHQQHIQNFIQCLDSYQTSDNNTRPATATPSSCSAVSPRLPKDTYLVTAFKKPVQSHGHHLWECSAVPPNPTANHQCQNSNGDSVGNEPDVISQIKQITTRLMSASTSSSLTTSDQSCGSTTQSQSHPVDFSDFNQFAKAALGSTSQHLPESLQPTSNTRNLRSTVQELPPNVIQHSSNCKYCGENVEDKGKKPNLSIVCENCGDAVPLDLQLDHACVKAGYTQPMCSLCGKATENMSATTDTDTNPTTSSNLPIPSTDGRITKRRGRKARCLKCGVICSSAAEKREHLARVHSDDFRCTICNAGLRSAENLRRHMMCHGPNPTHWCRVCGAGFTQPRGWRVHQAECERKIQEKEVFTSHKHQPANEKKRKISNKEKKFSCPECGDKFSVRPSVSRHIRIKHRGERPFVCEVCGKSFTSKYNKKVHFMKTHQHQPHEIEQRPQTCKQYQYQSLQQPNDVFFT